MAAAPNGHAGVERVAGVPTEQALKEAMADRSSTAASSEETDTILAGGSSQDSSLQGARAAAQQIQTARVAAERAAAIP